MARSTKKKKATARENATARVESRPRKGLTGGVATSTKGISQSRFPGETPLTGEDRPANRPGGKIRGQHGRATTTATGPRRGTTTGAAAPRRTAKKRSGRAGSSR